MQPSRGATSRLRLLLTAREGSQAMEHLGDVAIHHKDVPVQLPPIPETDAAELFLKRIRRPLQTSDFSEKLATEESKTPLSKGEVLQRICKSPLFKALQGVPGRIAEAASKVDDRLPSLL